ncbi:PI31 proteasome regulator N-terminal-domain-containing protein [Catenaria anguillulae PL171]|uniref:PI31 proteasome regulator N-terminal-domain-containing protein n=1 Tax=Catenaria anguillulae PL171 TaxID=765915 RepID=A0A1Y2I382_9FUNG|nr:PI31 proteasome regulator N-terminal-domain-containing protein [Catenaria anguillulae PL171]
MSSSSTQTPPDAAHDPGYDPAGLLLAIDRATSTAPTRIESVADLVALALHACFSIAGFRLIALSESANLSPPVESSFAALPADWNSSARTSGAYLFKYRHNESALTFVVKLVAMGTTTVLAHAMTEEESKVSNATLTPSKIVAEGLQFPVTQQEPVSALYKKEQEAQLREFMEQVKELIVALAPNLSKQGFQRMTATRETQTAGDFGPAAANRPHPRPLAPLGGGPPMVPPVGGPLHNPSPFSIGHSDLDPLGGMPPLGPTPFGGRGPAPGMGPFSGGDTGGGSIMGPGHPLFTGGVPAGPGRYWGGDGLLPPGAVPPGARFDPIGPQVGPFGGPGGVRPRPPPGRGGMPNTFPGEPDFDELPPPGNLGPRGPRGGGDQGGFGGGFGGMFG